MTNTPIIIMAGVAGSGKDTVGRFIAQQYNGVCIGQADPMKKFCKDVFGFTEDQLWGPSELRNGVVRFTPDEASSIVSAFHRNEAAFRVAVLPEGADSRRASLGLSDWFVRIYGAIEATGTMTPRHVLQTLGTEWGRSIDPQMWNQLAVKTCKALLGGDRAYSRAGGLTRSAGAGYDYAAITDGRFRNEILNTRYEGGLALKVERDGTDSVGNHSSETELASIPRHFFSTILDNNSSLFRLYQKVVEVMSETFDDNRGYGHYPFADEVV